MNKFFINTGDISSTLEIDELRTCNKLLKKISIIDEQANLKDNEVVIVFLLDTQKITLYFETSDNKLTYVDYSCDEDIDNFYLIKCSLLMFFYKKYNGYYLVKNTVSNNALVSKLINNLMINSKPTVKYHLELNISTDSNHLKLKIKDEFSNSYSVKNLYDFAYNFSQKNVTNYNNLSVIHDVSYFESKLISKLITLINNDHFRNYESSYSVYLKHSTNYILLTNSEIFELLSLTSSSTIDGKKYNIINDNFLITLDCVEVDSLFKVSLHEDICYNDYFYFLKRNNEFYISKYSNNNIEQILNTFKYPQLIYISELYDLYNLLSNNYKNQIVLDVDYEIFNDSDISTLYLNVVKSDNGFDINIEFEDNHLLDISRLSNVKTIMQDYVYINNFSYKVNEADIFKFLKYSIKELELICDVISFDEESQKYKITDNLNITLNVDDFGGKLKLEYLSPNLTPEQIELILNTDSMYFKTEDNTYFDLTSETLSSLINLNKVLMDEREVDSHNLLLIDEVSNKGNVRMKRKVKRHKITNYDILNFELRDYQQDGLDFLVKLHDYNINGLLADDMGLGKTIQIISLLNYLESSDTHLIVMPASLIYNWEKEIKKFSNNLSTLIYQGSKRKSQLKKFDNFDVVLVTYETLRRDISQFNKIKFDYVILDEAQYIKNRNSLIRKSVSELNSNHRLCLTGTPIENNISELYSIVDYLNPGYLGSYSSFSARLRSDSVDSLNMLRAKLGVIILRRTKDQVLTDLPPKQIETIMIPMSTLQRALYDDVLQQLQETLLLTNNKIEILSQITKLRQICTNPKLLDDKYQEVSPKYHHLIEQLETLISEEHKVIIFTQFTSNFKYLEELFTSNNISYYKISGSTKKTLRQTIVDKFNNDDTNVILISLKAGGSGLNIVGADTVIHLDPWWNSAVENQANDRAHRIGQTKPVSIYKLTMHDSIEENINEIQATKNKLSEDILDFDNNLMKLDKSEILKIIKGESI